ncbi:MAG: hypothetical protein JO293_03935 [Candidatus Eremiobacteraeota bacterium]|nr:hypothetical protein [Candidatus Eremiobacteraeota bacterium]
MNLRRAVRLASIIALLSAACLLGACGGAPRTRAQPANSAGEPETQCPLVTDADLAKLNPVLKRADDDWQSHNGSTFCDISFGVNLDTLSGNAPPRPFELLEIGLLRTSEQPSSHRAKDQCTASDVCERVSGVGDYGFFFKNNGRKLGTIRSEGVLAASGPYEISVIASYWKGGDPRPGAIAIAKKLAQEYR